jgi:hypothetical protein
VALASNLSHGSVRIYPGTLSQVLDYLGCEPNPPKTSASGCRAGRQTFPSHERVGGSGDHRQRSVQVAPRPPRSRADGNASG